MPRAGIRRFKARTSAPFMNPSSPHRTEEPDIGSGEKASGQPETDKLIRDVPHKPPAPGNKTPPEPPSPPAGLP